MNDMIINAWIDLSWPDAIKQLFGENSNLIAKLDNRLLKISTDAEKGNLFALTILKRITKVCPEINKRKSSMVLKQLAVQLKGMPRVSPKKPIRFNIKYESPFLSLIIREIHRLDGPISIIKSGIVYGKIKGNTSQIAIDEILEPLLSIYQTCFSYSSTYHKITSDDFKDKTDSFKEANKVFLKQKLIITEDILKGEYQHPMLKKIIYSHLIDTIPKTKEVKLEKEDLKEGENPEVIKIEASTEEECHL